LAWVDAGAATGSLANCLALAPIHERGTDRAARALLSFVRAAECSREKTVNLARRVLPYRADSLRRRRDRHAEARVRVRVERGGGSGLAGGQTRAIHHDMAFAKFVTAAVDSGDPRIKGTCMVILEETDPGTFDRGTPARTLVHRSPRPGTRFSAFGCRRAGSSAGTRERRCHHPSLQPRQVIEAVSGGRA